MGDIEYFATWTLFIGGIFLLFYLFAIRKRIIRKTKLLAAQAKAKLHYKYVSRPSIEPGKLTEEKVDPWRGVAGRDLR